MSGPIRMIPASLARTPPADLTLSAEDVYELAHLARRRLSCADPSGEASGPALDETEAAAISNVLTMLDRIAQAERPRIEPRAP